MNQRPKSVTLVCWMLIILSTISIFVITIAFNDPMLKKEMDKILLPVNNQYAWIYIGLLITLLSGAAMLKTQNWARFLFIGWSIVDIVLGFAIFSMNVERILSLIVFFIVAVILFRPKANEYFHPCWMIPRP